MVLKNGDGRHYRPTGLYACYRPYKDLIKVVVNGYQIVELENALMAYPLSKEASVIAVPDENGWSGRWHALFSVKEQSATVKRGTAIPFERFCQVPGA